MFTLRCIRKTVVVAPHNLTKRNLTFFNRSVIFFFKKNLLLTNSITSGLFMGIGDLIQQEFEIQAQVHSKYDWGRAGRMFIVGCAMGPLHHYYYLKLDVIMPKSDIITVIKKVFLDQLLCSPATLICFFYGMGYLEHKTFRESTDEIKNKFLYVYGGDCLFWPPVQLINFYYLPSMYRVMYINIATMVFNIFMSYMKHYDQNESNVK